MGGTGGRVRIGYTDLTLRAPSPREAIDALQACLQLQEGGTYSTVQVAREESTCSPSGVLCPTRTCLRVSRVHIRYKFRPRNTSILTDRLARGYVLHTEEHQAPHLWALS